MQTVGMRVALLAALLASCHSQPTTEPASAAADQDADGFTAASRSTTETNARVAASLPDDPVDFEEAKRGLIGSDPEWVVRLPNGTTRKAGDFSFLSAASPASVNPSLWRQAQLNAMAGLFQVADGIYQVRGYDISNMSLIRGRDGWIVVDPLTSVESATAAMALARKHLGNDPVTAVILTHSHIDHFGGVAAVLPADKTAVRVIAPKRFVEEVTSENVLAGTAMTRRARFQFGLDLPNGVRGYVDSGLGKRPAAGTVSLAVPTDIVDHTPQPLEIDGVEFVFQYAPESEAPAELTFYLPQRKAFCGAEIVSRTMHNLYTLRGAKVRDAVKWSRYIDEVLERFGDLEVVFTSHHWPVFGHQRGRDFLAGQRDTYRYIHDQTLRLANQGLTAREIAEQLELPPQLARNFANRGYYGTLRHNSKAVYQFYFGWYDSNPANLDPLPPPELGAKYVEAMGGPAAVKEKARAAFERGDYRWAATMLDHLVFSAPDDREARELLARTYDQLGYQAESGVWRSEYLSGAHELRHGIAQGTVDIAAAKGILDAIPLELFFDAMATRLNGPKAAAGDPVTINFTFTDERQTHVVNVANAVLHHRVGEPDPEAAATVKLTRSLLLRLGLGQVGLTEMIFSSDLDIDGSRPALLAFFRLLDPITPNFAIVTP